MSAAGTVILEAVELPEATCSHGRFVVAEFSLTSSAFVAGGAIPRRHACDGEDHSPPLSWSAPPGDARSLALILDDPDAPSGRFVHWLAWGITPDAGGLAEGSSRRWRGATTSARSAIGGHARRAAMGGTATASASTRWPRTCRLRPASACGSWNRP